jgi:NAD(P)-dependent dehydrogenase (short-subunit alcohol dehydrogenase family)
MGNGTMLTISLDERRALVTGGTRGIGQAITAALGRAGATVPTTVRSAPEQQLPLPADRDDQMLRAGADLVSAYTLIENDLG